jgi:hypothetical protein
MQEYRSTRFDGLNIRSKLLCRKYKHLQISFYRKVTNSVVFAGIAGTHRRYITGNRLMFQETEGPRTSLATLRHIRNGLKKITHSLVIYHSALIFPFYFSKIGNWDTVVLEHTDMLPLYFSIVGTYYTVRSKKLSPHIYPSATSVLKKILNFRSDGLTTWSRTRKAK